MKRIADDKEVVDEKRIVDEGKIKEDVFEHVKTFLGRSFELYPAFQDKYKGIGLSKKKLKEMWKKACEEKVNYYLEKLKRDGEWHHVRILVKWLYIGFFKEEGMDSIGMTKEKLEELGKLFCKKFTEWARKRLDRLEGASRDCSSSQTVRDLAALIEQESRELETMLEYLFEPVITRSPLF